MLFPLNKKPKQIHKRGHKKSEAVWDPEELWGSGRWSFDTLDEQAAASLNGDFNGSRSKLSD